jgi:hypothetical protein
VLICSNVSSSGEMIPSYEASDVFQENLMDQGFAKVRYANPSSWGTDERALNGLKLPIVQATETRRRRSALTLLG